MHPPAVVETTKPDDLNSQAPALAASDPVSGAWWAWDRAFTAQLWRERQHRLDTKAQTQNLLYCPKIPHMSRHTVEHFN